MMELLQTALPGLPPPKIGKVREVYDLGDALLIVATDRISAFDVVMANGIPDKGRVLNQMSAFWFEKLADVCPHHVLSVDDDTIQARLPAPQADLRGRTTLARKARPLTIECVARGYIAGSLYKDYLREGPKLLGLNLPDELAQAQKLADPIFTPATKAEEGHDENVSFNDAVDRVGYEVATQVREWTLKLYQLAAGHAARAGLILADTKFEFGVADDGLIWIDEALTPDSSRFWEASTYQLGISPPSVDKQYVRDFLEGSGWNKHPPGPTLPDDVVQRTRAKYLEAYERIVGRPLAKS